MKVYKKCTCCGKLHDITQLTDTKTWEHLTLFNCSCNGTLSVRTSMIGDVLMNNAWASKYDLKGIVCIADFERSTA